MPHGIWKGEITFGLVYIPVTLYTAESHQCDVKLSLLDKRDLSPIGYQKINKNSGEKVPADQIVEGYQYEDKSFVILTKEEIKKVHPKSENSIEILEFVNKDNIQLEYFEKPYYLEPSEKGKKGYALLREALQRTGKIGIAKVVIRTRQYLSALVVEDKALLLEIMRFPCELLSQTKFDFPSKNLSSLGIHANEIKIAEQLIKNMSNKWEPEKYKNEYQGSLLDFVIEKIKLGESHPIKKSEEKKPKKEKVIDIMHLLKQSIEKSKSKKKNKSTMDKQKTKIRKTS